MYSKINKEPAKKKKKKKKERKGKPLVSFRLSRSFLQEILPSFSIEMESAPSPCCLKRHGKHYSQANQLFFAGVDPLSSHLSSPLDSLVRSTS